MNGRLSIKSLTRKGFQGLIGTVLGCSAVTRSAVPEETSLYTGKITHAKTCMVSRENNAGQKTEYRIQGGRSTGAKPLFEEG